MAVEAPQKPDQDDQNPGDMSTRELFNRTLGQKKPTGEEGDNARAALSSAEEKAATSAGGAAQKTPLAQQEQNGFYKPTAQDLYAKGRANRAKGGGRGIFIGVGAGAGVVGIVAGFAFLMIFQLPTIMDALIDNSEKRVEKVFTRRIEKAIFKYFFVGDTIATGNPLGDFFANLRTSKFEAKLESKYGLSFERQENGSMRIVKSGTDLGTFNNADELENFLDRDITEAKELKKVIKLVVNNDISFFRILKRAKFKKWLMTKYSLTRLGPSDRAEDETDEEYNQRTQEEYAEDVNRQNLENLNDALTCADGDTDCADRTQSETSDEVEETIEQASQEATQEAAQEGAEATSKSMMTRITEKLVTAAASKTVFVIGIIDILSVIEHGVDEAINSDALQKMHAEYVSASSAVLAATMAGYSDATKAGAMDASTVGMFSEKFTGWESSVSYNYIQTGEVKGEDIDEMEKVNADATLPDFLSTTKTMFNTVGWAVRAPLKVWYYTAHQAIVKIGEYAGDLTSWLAEKTSVSDLLAQITPYMEQVFTSLFKLLGMYIDPLAVGSKLAMYIHQGFVASYDAFAQDSGMRQLTHDQAVAADNSIEEERMAELSDESAYDRLLNINSENSLVNKIASMIPTNTTTFAMSGLSLITNAPSNLAHIITPSAFAAEDDVIPEDLFGIYPYGGTEADLSAPLSPTTEVANSECPENSDDSFNHCKVDKIALEAASCALVGTSGCPDLNSSYTYMTDEDYTAFLLEDY